MQLLLLLAILLCGLQAAFAASAVDRDIPPGWQVVNSFSNDNPDVLRGYGRVSTTFSRLTMPDGKAQVTLVRFDAARQSKVLPALSKCLADLTLSPGVEVAPVEIAGRTFQVVTVEGGHVYTGAAFGLSAYLVSAPDLETLKSFVTAAPAFAAADTVTDVLYKYPQYLDRFDRFGWGFYSLAGVSNYHNWKALPLGGPDADPVEDLDFCAKHQFRFELTLDTSLFDWSYGMRYWPEQEWKIQEAEKRHLPMSCRLYGNLAWAPRFSEAQEQPAPWLQSGWHGGDLMWKSSPHQSWYHQAGRLYIAKQTAEQMRPLVKRDDVMSWMSPYGELVHNGWYNLHADYAPPAQESWRAYLKAQGLDLAQLSTMFRCKQPFVSWDQVSVPEFADFAGKPGCFKMLDGQWFIREETAKDEGVAGEWWKVDPVTAGWDSLQMPGSDRWLDYKGQRWCSRSFELAPAEIPAGKAYLYLFLKPAALADRNNPITIYLNGEEIGKVGLWGVLDVTGKIKPGSNRIAFRTHTFDGHVLLSTDTPAIYPYMGRERNQLWVMWKDWLRDGKYDAWAVALAAMCQTDPDRPIKFMAPTSFGADRWLRLADRYGGFAHFTGEGMWFFPWYKRYSYLYGLPGTSECAGPSNNVADQVSLVQRIFLAGLNGHDQVFKVQDVTRKPDVRAWYEAHIALLKQLGRYDISGPQVLLFRSTNAMEYLMSDWPMDLAGQMTPEIQTCWNWDIGRGTLQSSGHSYLYVDEGGVSDGKLNGYNVLMDCGNESVNPETLTQIEAWVRAGGTYIVWPFTGRSTHLEPDTWPIHRLTGCKIKAMRKPGKGEVTIAKDQSLLKELAGKTFPDTGYSTDYLLTNHNLLSTELEAGADAKVIATFENGSAAIVERKLGAGRVIALGSAFFRQSKDVTGIWWPEELEVTFFRDLLAGLGMSSVNTTTDLRVWPQRYRMNNGLDEVVVLDNFAKEDRTVTLTATVDRAPAQVYEVALNTVRKVPFQHADGQVTIPDIKIGKGEVAIYILRANTADDAMQHWWGYQQRLWRSKHAEPVDFSSIESGRWKDPVKELVEGWRWTQVQPADDWVKPSFKDGEWKQGSLDVMNFQGAESGKVLYFRKHFTIADEWWRDGGVTHLVQGGWDREFCIGRGECQLYLNGVLLHDWNGHWYYESDVTQTLREGDNVLALVVKPGKSRFVGVLGSTFLHHEPRPEQTLDLSGPWMLRDGKREEKLPGKFDGAAPTRRVVIPAEWREKYQVTFRSVGNPNNTFGVYVNDRLVRRHHHLFGDVLEVDITPMLRFGEANELVLFKADGDRWHVREVELRLYSK